MIQTSSLTFSVFLALIATAPFLQVAGQNQYTVADCAAANTLWKQFGQTTDISSDCCRTFKIVCDINGRITALNWAFTIPRLKNTISDAVCSLGALRTLELYGNEITGSIPSCLGSFKRLRNLWLFKNKLTGSIPAELGNATILNQIYLQENQLTGPIPSSLGNLSQLEQLYVHNNQLNGSIPESLTQRTTLTDLLLSDNQLSGPIPSSIGNLKKLRYLYLHRNNLTGFPQSLLNVPGSKSYFPNPMSTIPYDAVKPVSVGLITNVTWSPFMTTADADQARSQVDPFMSTEDQTKAPIDSFTSPHPSRRSKRQVSGTSGDLSIEQLRQICPINNVLGGTDVAAGCISGIFVKYCTNPYEAASLRQCHQAYNVIFQDSIYKSLGAVCPAWKSGPRSSACLGAVSTFSYDYYVGTDSTGNPLYIRLGSSHASELVRNIFGSTKFAPCIPSSTLTCIW